MRGGHRFAIYDPLDRIGNLLQGVGACLPPVLGAVGWDQRRLGCPRAGALFLRAHEIKSVSDAT
jgi:hypothetical protein